MMRLFDILVESRMREWQNRPELEKEQRRDGHEERISYEAQIVNEIDRLIDRSKSSSPEQRAQLLRTADDRTTELLMMLERRGNNLTAKLVSEKIGKMRQNNTDQDCS